MWHSAEKKHPVNVFSRGLRKQLPTRDHWKKHNTLTIEYLTNFFEGESMWRNGRRARLRGVWSNPWGFKSPHRHHKADWSSSPNLLYSLRVGLESPFGGSADLRTDDAKLVRIARKLSRQARSAESETFRAWSKSKTAGASWGWRVLRKSKTWSTTRNCR